MKTWKRHLGLWVLFGLLVGMMTLPASLTLSTRLIGNNVDNWIFYWNDWWLATALAEHHSLLSTPYAFFPHGASLTAHSNSFMSSLLALPLRPWLGPVAASNLVWLFGLWAGAVGMFWLVYELTRSTPAALVAGFVFAFAPYHLTQALSHAHLGSIQWWPWYALCLQRAVTRGRHRDALAAGLFAAMTLWSGLQLAVMLALWTVLYLGALLASKRGRTLLVKRLPTLAPSGLLALLLCAPLLLPIAQAWESGWTVGFDEGLSHQSDLLAYLLPPTYHPLWGDVFQPLYERFVANRAYMPYLGYTTLVLALVALIGQVSAMRPSRNAGDSSKQVPVRTGRPLGPGFWALTFALWTLLAAGNALRFNGTLYEAIRLPYAWIGGVFPLSTLRSPDRLNLLGVFSLAVLAGYGVAWVARRRCALLLPLGLLLLSEYLCLPLLRWDLLPDSPFYAQMAQEPPDYAVLDYPMGYDQAKLWLYYQTVHGKPTVEGHISRYSPELYTLITSNALVRALYQVTLEDRPRLLPEDAFVSQPVPLRDLGPALRELNDAGVRYVLVHKPYVDAKADAHVRCVLPLAPVYEDETLAVYDLRMPPAVAHGDFPVALSPSLALWRFDVDWQDGVGQVQVLAQKTHDGDAPVACTLALEDDDVVWATTAFTLFEATSGQVCVAGDLDVKDVTLRADGALLPGEYGLELKCNGASYRPVECLRFTGESEMVYSRSEPTVVYDEVLALAGYRWRTAGATLRLDLWWDVLRAPGADYKLFVHLLDADGALVAQYDAIPCAWTCPTSTWQAGQQVHDTAELRLWNLPAGSYRIALGWYRPEDGTRLMATGAAGEPFADGYAVLDDVFVIRHFKPGVPAVSGYVQISGQKKDSHLYKTE